MCCERGGNDWSTGEKILWTVKQWFERKKLCPWKCWHRWGEYCSMVSCNLDVQSRLRVSLKNEDRHRFALHASQVYKVQKLQQIRHAQAAAFDLNPITACTSAVACSSLTQVLGRWIVRARADTCDTIVSCSLCAQAWTVNDRVRRQSVPTRTSQLNRRGYRYP